MAVGRVESKNKTMEGRVKLFCELLESLAQINKGFILSGLDDSNRPKMLKRVKELYPDSMVVPSQLSPKDFYFLLKSNRTATVIFDSDILSRRKEWISLLEGAVCSSPNSGDSWEVDYMNEGSFKFQGRTIVLTPKSLDEIGRNKKYEHLNRDCVVL